MSKDPEGNGGPQSKWNLFSRIVEWVLDFLGKQFPGMPKWVRVFVYLGVYVVFLVIVGVLIYALFFPSKEGDIEIIGRLTGPDRAAISDMHIIRDLAAENLFVYKKPTAVSSRFTYEWILRVSREKLSTPVAFAISEFDTTSKKPQALCENSFTPAELQASSYEGVTSLEVDNFFTALRLAKPPEVPGGVRPAGYVSVLGTLLRTSSLQSRPSAQSRVLAKDSAALFLKEFRAAKNPVAQMQLRTELSYADPLFTIQLAESLRSAVLGPRTADITTYARILTDNRNLALLTSSGEYRSIFDATFYGKAVELLHTGRDSESRSMASFLRALQDARTLQYLYHEFEATNSPLAKILCLNVLEGFSTNSSPVLKEEVENKLREFEAKETSKEIRQAITETLATFRSLGRTGD
jgi:hypothetical protein